MNINRRLALAGIVTLVIAVGFWLVLPKNNSAEDSLRDDSLAWFEAGKFEIGVATVPGTPQVGENDLIVKVRLADGEAAINAEVSAYAEMAAMGSMPAMRAPADLLETTAGQFKGAVDLRMRGAWPLTVSITDAVHANAKMSFDLATDRPRDLRTLVTLHQKWESGLMPQQWGWNAALGYRDPNFGQPKPYHDPNY